MNYYTSDLHLGHENIIAHCSRPFSDAEEMDRTIITNWNSIIKDNDDVYILGDIAFKLTDHDSIPKIKSLKGRKHLIVGNHDVKNLKDARFRECFVSVDSYLEIKENGRNKNTDTVKAPDKESPLRKAFAELLKLAENADEQALLRFAETASADMDMKLLDIIRKKMKECEKC